MSTAAETAAVPHEHVAVHKGPFYEVCSCGASRRAEFGKPPLAWHACALCAPSVKAST